MNRKHFEMIADAIASTMAGSSEKVLLVNKLCEVFISTNANFNWQRFIKACEANND